MKKFFYIAFGTAALLCIAIGLLQSNIWLLAAGLLFAGVASLLEQPRQELKHPVAEAVRLKAIREQGAVTPIITDQEGTTLVGVRQKPLWRVHMLEPVASRVDFVNVGEQ